MAALQSISHALCQAGSVRQCVLSPRHHADHVHQSVTGGQTVRETWRCISVCVWEAPASAEEASWALMRACMQGDLLCCETCPAVMHAQCAGLEQAPKGDWHCSSCTCAACGHAATDLAEEPTPPQVGSRVW